MINVESGLKPCLLIDTFNIVIAIKLGYLILAFQFKIALVPITCFLFILKNFLLMKQMYNSSRLASVNTLSLELINLPGLDESNVDSSIPDPPNNYFISSRRSNSVILNWTDNSINEDGFKHQKRKIILAPGRKCFFICLHQSIDPIDLDFHS